MNREQLFGFLSGVEESYVLQAHGERKRTRRIPGWLTLAACLCLVLTGSVYSLARLGYFGASCGGNPGAIVDGAYYFNVGHDGVYRYENGELERVLGAWWTGEWSVNDYGVYYSCGRSFGVVPHETGKREVLYRSGLFTSSFVRHTLRSDGTVVLTIYDKRRETKEELLLDGKTGEVLETVMPETHYDDVDITYSESRYLVGERELILVPTDDPYDFDVQENGVSLLPEGVTVSRHSARYFGDCLGFICAYPEKHKEGSTFFARPDGNDTLLTVPADHYYNTGTDKYLMDVQYTGEGYEVWCLDTMTNEAWELTVGEGPAIYSIETDGALLYACVPWDDYQALWKVICDGQGRPVSLELLDGDILT